MKKKIISIILVSMLFGGVVSAASLWGTYKGNEIIRITSNNTPIKTQDVPAISYDGRTMIPINMLGQIGVKYTWDQKNKTVDIKSNSQQFDPIGTTNTIISLGGGGVTISNISGDITATTLFQAIKTFDEDWYTISRIFAELQKFNAPFSRIEYVDGQTNIGYVEVETKYLQGFINGSITEKKLNEKMIFHNY